MQHEKQTAQLVTYYSVIIKNSVYYIEDYLLQNTNLAKTSALRALNASQLYIVPVKVCH
jgi:hypothetical protein